VSEFNSYRSFLLFASYVRNHRRYRLPPEHLQFLRALVETGQRRIQTIKAGSVFFRAQAGHEWRTEGTDEDTFEVECAFPASRMKPLTDRASEGRANPKGIPYLYVATSEKAAVGECRPWVGARVSVSQMRTVRDLKILNCTSKLKGTPIYLEEPPPLERERAVWRDIDRAFAEPVTRADDTADYVPTQIVAELFREHGIDGIGYRSALGSGLNLALFDLDCADVINGQLVKVDRLDIDYSLADNPYFVSKFYGESAPATPAGDGATDEPEDGTPEER